MDHSDEFNIITRAQTDRLRQQDRDDLNNELRGTDVGRMSRFLSPEVRDMINGGRKGEKGLNDIIHQTMLDLLLMDDDYRQLYDDAMDRLRDLEDATQQALDQALIQQAKSQEQLRQTLERAAILDGQHVFKDARGRVWTEHDQRVKDSDTDRIEWKGNEPSREAYHSDRANAHASQRRVDDLRAYQTDTLGSARDRLTDKDNPLTKDELKGLIEDFDTQLAETKRQPKPSEASPEAEGMNSDLSAAIPKL